MTKNKTSETRKSEIIDAAIDEFLQKGYEGASMNGIAQRAGLSKGGIYHHFSSKEEILYEANLVLMAPINSFMINAKIESDANKALREYINNYLKHWKNHTKELEFIFLTLTKSLQNKLLWTSLNQYAKDMTAFFEGLFIKGIMTGKFKKHNPKSRAIALFAMLDGVIIYLVTNEEITIEYLANQIYELFINEISL